MSNVRPITLRTPYLIFLGDIVDPIYAKTGKGIADWCPNLVAGQVRLPGCKIDLAVPDLSVEEAAAQGIGSLIIGGTFVGGKLPHHWITVIHQAIEAGIDIVSGLHSKLMDVPEFVEAVQRTGSRLVDVRTPPRGIPVGSGQKRSGKRVLTVGTDCAVGKKYTALALAQSLNDIGVRATFRATGQTGIMLAGTGIAVDAVIADFVSGAAELISPPNDENHWDVIEGQGSLFHPGYAGVSLGLIHGSQPDALVMCHDATRTNISGWPGYATPALLDCMKHNLICAKLTNPDARFVGISINSSGLPLSDRKLFLKNVARETNLPCVDPVADGAAAIARYLSQLDESSD